MSDLGIVVCLLAFGLFCGGIGALSAFVLLSNREDDLKMEIYTRLLRAYGPKSAPVCLFKREFLD